MVGRRWRGRGGEDPGRAVVQEDFCPMLRKLPLHVSDGRRGVGRGARRGGVRTRPWIFFPLGDRGLLKVEQALSFSWKTTK